MMVVQSRQIATMASQLQQLAPEEAEPPEDAATQRARGEIIAVMQAVQQSGGEEARQLTVHQHAELIAFHADFLVEALLKGQGGTD